MKERFEKCQDVNFVILLRSVQAVLIAPQKIMNIIPIVVLVDGVVQVHMVRDVLIVLIVIINMATAQINVFGADQPQLGKDVAIALVECMRGKLIINNCSQVLNLEFIKTSQATGHQPI